MIDNNTRLLYQNGGQETFGNLKNQPGFKDVLNGMSGIFYASNDSGEQVVSFAPIPSLGWGLLVEEPWQGLSIPLLPSTQNPLVLLIPVLLLVLIVLWFGIQQILLPLRRLESQVASLAEGDSHSFEQSTGGIPEIRDVQAALIALTNRLEFEQGGTPPPPGILEGGGSDEVYSSRGSGRVPDDQVD